MKITKHTIKANKVFLFSCIYNEATESMENNFKAWIMDYFADQYPDKGVSIFTKNEHPTLLAMVVIDINEDQEADIEEIDIQE